MTYYKLTNQNLQTYDGFQWTVGKWEGTNGAGELCSPGWLHCYDDKLLAVLLNPIHANIQNPRLFRVDVSGKKKTNNGLKFGFSKMRLVEEIPLPGISTIQRGAFGILCALTLPNNATAFIKWSNDWLSGKDRSEAVAWDASRAVAWDAAWAAESDAAWAAATINLKQIARQAMRVT